MSSAVRRPLGGAAAAIALAAAAFVGTVAAPATHATAAPCTAPQVAIVVNFGHWGKPVQRACATWSSSLTGYTLLNNHGFATVGTHHDGPEFICRVSLNGTKTYYPTAEQEACNLTPPASAYWSYWHAQQGDTQWEYSQLGAMGYHPKKGSVDVWTFGATDVGGTSGQPPFPPSAVLPAAAASGGDATHRSSPQQPGTTAGSHSDGSHSDGSTTNRTSAGGNNGGTSAGRSSTSAGGSHSTSSTSSASGTGAANGAPLAGSSATTPSVQDVAGKPAARSKAAGTAGPLLATVGLVVALGAGGGVLVWRRRTGT
ncbi:MAG: hypothetical protein ACR2KJ_02945 [Jatrophihabitans sp.]